jgi:hypothetical protein
MLTPSTTGDIHAHDVYNFFQSQLRISIERSFGILITVFAIFQKPLRFGIPKCCHIVQTSMRIHNWRIDRGCQRCQRSVHLSYLSHDPSDLILQDDRYTTANQEASDRRNRYERIDVTKTQRRNALIEIIADLNLEVWHYNCIRIVFTNRFVCCSAHPTIQLDVLCFSSKPNSAHPTIQLDILCKTKP